MRRALALVALTAVLTLSLVAPLAAATPTAVQEDPDAGVSNSTTNSSGYTLEELRRDGKHYSVPSARIVPEEQRVFWLEHQPPNKPWETVSEEENGPKFDTSNTLRTNTLYLRTIRAQTDTESATVKIVSWEPETRTVKEDNTTTTERVAANVTVQEQQVSLGPGWSVGEISMPKHDEEKHVTMWIEGREDTARWTFTHKSVATTQEVDVQTWGDLLWTIVKYVGLTVLIGGAFVGKKVRNAVESAAIGPQWGFGKWMVAITVVTAAIAYYLFTAIAEMIVVAPYLIGLWLVAVMGAYMLSTHTGEIATKGFLKPDIENAVSFTNAREGDADIATDGGSPASYAYDVLQGEFGTAKTIEDENGVSIVRPGLVAFLARIYGARARIENIESLTARMQLPGSSPDEIFFVDPEADDLIEYEAPGFSLDIPDWDRSELVTRGLGLAVAGYLVHQLGSLYSTPLVFATAGAIAVYAFAKLYVKPTDGYARIEPAPMHFRQAFASTLMLSSGLRDARNFEEAKKKWRKEKLKNRSETQKELDEFDRDMMDFLAGDDVSEEFEELTGARDQTPDVAVPDGGDRDDRGEDDDT